MTIPDLSLLGDAVHYVCVYLGKHPLGFDEPFEKRIKHLQTSTPYWNRIAPEYQDRIRTHWHSIAGLYTEARSAWFEMKGQKGLKPDMVRRMPDEYQVLEFKITDSDALSKRSRAQVLDVMALIRSRAPDTKVIKGYRVILPIDLNLPPEPVWHEIEFTPAS